MIEEFITDVCELLEIGVPKISYDTLAQEYGS